MPCTHEIFDEINVLARYNLATTQEGIKVHKGADPAVIAAVRRLHDKDLLTQSDGGYLTPLGREAAEHVQAALTLLMPAG
ncbi:MAG TPA: TIGR02647 family protein [Methylococcaceae bacterium]|nr:TIGR02647 family protein [Methylococcaceae bacterium]